MRAYIKPILMIGKYEINSRQIDITRERIYSMVRSSEKSRHTIPVFAGPNAVGKIIMIQLGDSLDCVEAVYIGEVIEEGFGLSAHVRIGKGADISLVGAEITREECILRPKDGDGDSR